MELKIKDKEICNYTNFTDTVLSRLKRQEKENQHKRYSLLKRASILEKYDISDDDLLLLVDLKNRFNKEQ